jgi:transcription initiation factor TFIIB
LQILQELKIDETRGLKLSLSISKKGAPSGHELCPFCRGYLTEDKSRGEFVCPECGYVVEEQTFESSPIWKAMEYEDRMRISQNGSPTTYSKHDLGLSTEISPELRDSHGKYLGGASRENAERIKKWDRRIKVSGPGERSLANALSKISEIASLMRLPASTIEEAALIFRKSARVSAAKKQSQAGMAAATVYLACRRSNINRSLKEIATFAGVKSNAAAKYYRVLLGEVGDVYIPPPSVQKYISKLVNKEKINPRVERLALELADKTNESEISSGKTPAGLAAAYVYIASVLAGEHIPQREIAEYAEVTEVTVRNRCREILEKFVITQRLRPLREIAAVS